MKTNKSKSVIVTFFLNLFLGMFGADRFYLGKIYSGIAKLILVGGVYFAATNGLFISDTQSFNTNLKLASFYVLIKDSGLVYLWLFIDMWPLINGKTKTKTGEDLAGYEKNKRAMTIVFVILVAGLVLNLLSNLSVLKNALTFLTA